MKAIIFSAGLGTRLQEETRRKPKALVEVGGKSLLQHAIEKLTNEGIHEIVVNVHHFPELILDFLKRNDFGADIKISDETNKLLETGGALKKAAPLLRRTDEPVLLYNVDVLSNIHFGDLLSGHTQTGALATLVVRDRKTQRYLRFDADKRLVGWINRKTGIRRISIPPESLAVFDMAFSGISLVSPGIFDLMPEQERFSLTDFYLNLAKDHLIKGFFDQSDLWMDAGKPESLKKARELFE